MLAAIGCGGAPDPDGLDGTGWVFSNSNTCSTGLTFTDGDYELLFLCSLPGGTYGLQVNAGHYDIAGRDLNVLRTRASCDWAVEQSAYSWAIESGNLVLQNTAGIASYDRIPPGGGYQFLGTFGCFDADLNFTPMAVHDL